MGRKITVIFIGLLILGSSLMSISYTYGVKETLTAMLLEAQQSVENNNMQKAQELSEEIDDYWQEQEPKLIIYINHQEIDQLTDVISQLPSLIKYQNLSVYSSQVDQAISSMEHIWTTQLPLLQNIL
ncbi:MAG: DUF4363 family protein [Oscillospiraceae bacterium]|jgi:hypothetical protein